RNVFTPPPRTGRPLVSRTPPGARHEHHARRERRRTRDRRPDRTARDHVPSVHGRHRPPPAHHSARRVRGPANRGRARPLHPARAEARAGPTVERRRRLLRRSERPGVHRRRLPARPRRHRRRDPRRQRRPYPDVVLGASTDATPARAHRLAPDARCPPAGPGAPRLTHTWPSALISPPAPRLGALGGAPPPTCAAPSPAFIAEPLSPLCPDQGAVPRSEHLMITLR